MRKDFKTALKEKIDDQLESARRSQVEFETKLKRDGLAYTLRTSDKYFEISAMAAVWCEINELSENKELINIVKKKVMNGSRFPVRSTSPCHNAMALCELQAWAEALEWIQSKQSEDL